MVEATIGAPLPEWRLGAVSADKMRLLAAILRDPNPIHWDRDEAAKRTGQPRLINQGPTNVGYVTNMLLAWAGPRALRRLKVRFTANVFDGEAVVAGGTVVAVRDTPAERLIDCEVWLDKGDGTRAVAGTATVGVPYD